MRNAHSGKQSCTSKQIIDHIKENISHVPLYSELEMLVICDMRNEGLDYPFIEVETVKSYWRKRLS